MFILMIIAFIAGYTAIALEHNLKINKAAIALITGMVLWTLYAIGGVDILSSGLSSSWNDYVALNPGKNSASDMINFITHIEILEHLMDIASILFFLIGAMTIVEIIDRHQGLKILTDKITTRNKIKLLWIICLLTFILSALLDNLTTTIVMIAVIRKLMTDKTNRWIFTSMVIISANAGGAWSPVGDVTTIMLWIGGQVTTMPLIKEILLPSFVTMLIPLIIMSRKFKKVSVLRPYSTDMEPMEFSYKERVIILVSGLSCLIFVPIFKTLTHLPPYVGMLLALGVLWIITDIVHKKKDIEVKRHYDAARIIRKIDTPTILYFFGILTAVAALQSAGQLAIISDFLDTHLGNVYFIDLAIGLMSSTIDNSALVAGTMGMYPLEAANATGYAANFIQDGSFWAFLAYCAGTGGSILIIGSAAGVAAMGLEKINFVWYMKNFSRMAITGYFGGALTFYLMRLLM
jgi:Na+/H+ antiporter NhaD/arsenite permease-like protein